MSRLIGMLGQRFGRLVVTARAEGPSRTARWACVCDCGNTSEVRGGHLRQGLIRSCGCLENEVRGDAMRTHGMSTTPEYKTWKGMIRRCEVPTEPHYERYGGRGIKVCALWRGSFEAFFAEVGPRPSARHTIDRIDNEGHYEPGNCRWATKKEQSQNRSNVRMLTAFGRTQCLADWAAETGIHETSLRERLDRLGWSVEKAVSTPPRKLCRAAYGKARAA